MSNPKMTNTEQNDTKKAASKVRHIAAPIASRASAKAKADEFALSMKPILADLAEEGITGRCAVARALRERGVPTPRGGEWDARKVTNLVGRIAVMKAGA